MRSVQGLNVSSGFLVVSKEKDKHAWVKING